MTMPDRPGRSTAVDPVARVRRGKGLPLDAVVSVLIIAAIFGYPLTATFPIFLAVDTQVFSVPYRAVVVGLTFAALGFWFVDRRRTAVPLGIQCLLATTVAILSLRFYYHAVALGLPPHPVQNAEGFALFFYGVTLVPVLALAVPLRSRALTSLHRRLMQAGVLTAVMAISAIGYWVPDLEATARAEGEGLNAISYASVGALLILLAWSAPAESGSRWNRLPWRLCCYGLGLVPLVTAASRGPIVALLAVLAIERFVTSGARRWRTLAWVVVVSALLVGFGAQLADVLGDADDAIAIARRLSDIREDQSTIERLLILDSSWAVFAASPLVGGAMVEPLLKAYPHNVILEALMVGGLPFGALLFGLLLAAAIRSVHLMACVDAAPVVRYFGMFALYTLGMSMLSGSLYRGPDLWAALVLCFSCALPRRRATGSPARRTRPSAIDDIVPQRAASSATQPS